MALFEPIPSSAYKCPRLQRLKTFTILNLGSSLCVTALFTVRYPN